MIYDNLTPYEKQLVMAGFEGMDADSQNYLVNAISRKTGITLWQIKPEDILNYHKNLKISMQNEFCEIAIAAGFTSSNGHKYRTNTDDQINFLGKMIMLQMKPDITEVPWKTEDAGYIVHTKEDWLTVASEGFAHKEEQLLKFNEKTTTIKNATTHAQIVAVSWSNTKPNL